jgi:hypothetical protein
MRLYYIEGDYGGTGEEMVLIRLEVLIAQLEALGAPGPHDAIRVLQEERAIRGKQAEKIRRDCLASLKKRGLTDVRALNALARHHYDGTVPLSYDEAKEIRNLGKKSIALLQELGLMEEDE